MKHIRRVLDNPETFYPPCDPFSFAQTMSNLSIILPLLKTLNIVLLEVPTSNLRWECNGGNSINVFVPFFGQVSIEKIMYSLL